MTREEANCIVITNLFHRSNPVSDMVKGFCFSAGYTFETIKSMSPDTIIDYAGCWYFNRAGKIALRIVNHYKYGALFCHHHNNMFNTNKSKL